MTKDMSFIYRIFIPLKNLLESKNQTAKLFFIKERKGKTMKFQLIDYFDVWGNEEEGWEVNSLARTDIYIDIDTKNDDETDILIKLVEAEYLNPKAIDEICVNWLEVNFIEMETEKGYPIGRLEADWEEVEGMV